MNRFVVALTLVALVVGNVAWALPGPAPVGGALGEYDPVTGQIVVSVNGVNNWYVEHVGSQSMTGDTPLGLPTSGGLVSNNDSRIGESSFSLFSVTDLNLGNVAQPGLPGDGSLKIFWNAGLGSSLQWQPLAHPGLINTPPMADIYGPVVVNTYNDPLNILLNASNSTDEGLIQPLSFKWDLDDDGTFEFDTGMTSTLEIADVSSTFGGLGSYPVAVEVYDGTYWDVASTTVDLIYEEPPPPPVNTPPTAVMNGPFVVNTFSDPLSILLDGRDSTDDGLDRSLSFEWDLDDDGVYEVNSTGFSTYLIDDVTETFGETGTFPISMRAFDGRFYDVASTTVDISYDEINTGPTARINSSYTIYIDQGNLSVVLNASNSTDDGLTQPLSFVWDLDDDGAFEVDTGFSSTLTIADVLATFGGTGNYPIAVEVFDGEFSDVDGSTVRLRTTPPPPDPTIVSATYDPSTGEISVSVSGVINWYIESASSGLTGDAPAGLPGGAGLVTDNDTRIGETAFAQFAYDVNLGNVAQPNLPWDDLSLFWNSGLGDPLQSTMVNFPGGAPFIPEPTGMVLLGMGLLGLGCCRGRRAVR